MPRTFEIYNAAIDVGEVDYLRPCILLPDRGGAIKVFVLGLSTKNYSERGQSFLLSSDHPGVAATGSKFTSYTIHPPQEINRSQLSRKLGVLQGTLADDFAEWMGLP